MSKPWFSVSDLAATAREVQTARYVQVELLILTRLYFVLTWLYFILIGQVSLLELGAVLALNPSCVISVARKA